MSDGGLRVVGQLNDEQITSLSVVTISPASQVHWQYINDGMTHEYQTMFALRVLVTNTPSQLPDDLEYANQDDPRRSREHLQHKPGIGEGGSSR